MISAQLQLLPGAFGGEVLRRHLQDAIDFRGRLIDRAELDQRAREREACRGIAGMLRKTHATDANRLFVFTGAAVFFGQLRKRDRRGILPDPASKLLDAGDIGHPPILACLPGLDRAKV